MRVVCGPVVRANRFVCHRSPVVLSGDISIFVLQRCGQPQWAVALRTRAQSRSNLDSQSQSSQHEYLPEYLVVISSRCGDRVGLRFWCRMCLCAAEGSALD